MLRLALGLVGVLIAALTFRLNDRVSDIALGDIRAATSISYDQGSWIMVFWQVAPSMLSAMLLIGWDLPQDPLRTERFLQIDLFGVVTGCNAIALLILVLTQGDRLAGSTHR